MAYLLFNNQTNNTGLSKIIENDTVKNNLLMDVSGMTFVTISDADFTELKNEIKSVESRDGDTVTYSTNHNFWVDKEPLQKKIDEQIKIIRIFTDKYTSHPFHDEWNTFKNSLESLNLDDITYPCENSLKELCDERGITFKNILELPL